jgi:hypothetical protein
LLDEGLNLPKRFFDLFGVELHSSVRSGTLLFRVGLPLSFGFFARLVSLVAVRRLGAVLRTVLDGVLLLPELSEPLKTEHATYPSRSQAVEETRGSCAEGRRGASGGLEMLV